MTGARPPAPMPVPVVAVPVVPVVAVQVGTTATRLAAPGADGRPELVATLPAGTSASSALESLYGDASVPVVVLVHPSGRDADEVRVDAAELRAAAGTVRTVPAPVSVLAGTRDAAPPASDVSGGRPEGVLGGRSDPWTGASAGPEPVREAGSRVSVTPRLPMTPTAALASLSPVVGPGTVPVAAPVLVVDVGASGTELTVVVGERAMPAHRMDVGGDRLDAALGAATGVGPARARAVRESLSLRTEVVLPGGDRCDADRCREVIRPVLVGLAAAVAGVARRSGATGVVLAGGLARTPLLAELLDDAVDVPVRVVEVPEAAAVLGALRIPDPALGVAAGPRIGPVASGDRDGPCLRESGVGPATSPSTVGPNREATRSRRAGRAGRRRAGPAHDRRRVRGAPAVAALGIALVAVGAVAGRAPTVPDPPDGRTLVQYGYTTVLPTGWEHTGGLPDRRRSLLTRTGSPDGAELIAVERTPLGYDSSVEPERARAELAAEFRRRAAAQDLRDYRGDTVAGRPVLRYRQAGPGASVDWFVLFAGTDELVVGCRYPDAPAVTAACAAVVASVRPAG